MSVEISAPPPKKVKLDKNMRAEMTKEDLLSKWQDQEAYIRDLETKLAEERTKVATLEERRSGEESFQSQIKELTRIQSVCLLRLNRKDAEIQDLMAQLQEARLYQTPVQAQLRQMALDPAVSTVMCRLNKEVTDLRQKLEESQNELSAWKFTPDSHTGKRLMAKCRLLYNENEELGKQVSSGRIAKLENDLALQRSYAEELKKDQSGIDSFLADLEMDAEGMQSTIQWLQATVRRQKDEIRQQAEEVQRLTELVQRTGSGSGAEERTTAAEAVHNGPGHDLPMDTGVNGSFHHCPVDHVQGETNPLDKNIEAKNSVDKAVADKVKDEFESRTQSEQSSSVVTGNGASDVVMKEERSENQLPNGDVAGAPAAEAGQA